MVVPFDQYQRYKNAADLINLIREDNKAFSILEVGANEHKNLEKFLVTDKITYLDIIVPEELKSDPSYIEGDATNMPIETDTFDLVIALDVFEHISPLLRQNFISELMRVSKHGFILAAPFNTTGVENAEIRANKYFETMYGFNYQWLEEHRQNGLPEAGQLIDFLNEKQWPYLHFTHGRVDIWEKMIKIHFLATGRSSLYSYRESIDDYYNTNIYQNDFNGPCYRNFFFVSENLNMIKKTMKMIDTKNENPVSVNVLENLDNLEKDLINLSVYDLTHKELISKNFELKQKDELIEKVLYDVKQKDELIEKFTNEMQNKEELLRRKNAINEELNNLITMKEQDYKRLESEKQLVSTENLSLLEQVEILHTEVNLLKEENSHKDNYVQQLELISQQLRIKNRIKKIVPKKLRSKIKFGQTVFKKLKDNPSLAKKGINELRRNGFNSLNSKMHSAVTVSELTSDYAYQDINLEEIEELKIEIEKFTYRPLISIIIPVYNVEPKWLEIAINSVKEQLYSFWEICIVDDSSDNINTIKYLEGIDDPRIKIKTLKINSGISSASNEAVSLAEGEYIALLDNDDEITRDALYQVVKSLNQEKSDILYSDEDKVDEYGKKKCPLHKPDWSPDLLRSQMYIGHFLVFKRELFHEVGGFRTEFNGSQDYDLVLRMSERSSKIHHIPKVLYSWRELETSTALNPYSKPYAHTAGLAALNEHLVRVFGEGNAYATEDEHLFVYDSRYKIKTIKASIIIPTKDKIELLEPCVSSIIQKTKYPDYEIIIVNNNSVEQETLDWFKQQNDKNVKIIDANYDFNWSKLNNHGIKEANGEVFIFLNNDTVVIKEDWLQRLVEKAQRDDVGTVGGLLLYEDKTIQHAGVVIGLGGWADHIFKSMAPNHFGSPFISPMVTRNVIASTGACLAISKKTLDKIGLFNEDFIICGSDVEISLRALQHNLVNIYDPHVRLYHLESKSRSSYIPPIDFELSALFYGPYLKSGDPYFNKNLSLNSLVPKLSQGE